MSGDNSDSDIASEDAVIPPPPPEAPIPEGLLTPPRSEASTSDAVIPPADVVIPPPPPEAELPATRRSRPRPAILTGEQPASAAADWAQPSVAPEVPTSGGYRVLTVVIFAVLTVLLIGAIAAAFYLGSVTFALGTDSGSLASVAALPGRIC